ncbi:MAG: Na+/H+ antiporter NhaC [Turicibacter sp.]|mgnify:FL=1|uniref:Na+/H+ antiporter NhaC n=1 Tax=unclassified Turicibacter TaxID=2638206 RepID=UPI00137AB6CD|nr:Na+/H+ antiporter NhaC [Turicibacter sp. TA25]MCI8701992.1 Na+/H+ antiporter NhaC [Turicibacter sp.]MCI9350709.1 Na+/H+ antiporter NhaC [Turicibacter sp.]MCU7204459.1 Na+/H+ antiporter NhaC [Turicibacter sp. TA25]NCE79124.1 Na+/H+ antiporter NhaC [Turicibacter sp. TS3]
MKKARQATLVEALIPIIFLIIILGLSLTLFKVDPQIPLLLGTVVAALIGVYRLGFKWEELENGIIQTITMAVQAILILLIVGTLIGTWILSGVVPSMIYWGLNILSPSIFLVATLLICSIVAVSTGSSWTTAGTVGIALLGIGQTLGISAPIIAGAIISGAYFGDKMSPLSDTTNLAPAMAGAHLFEHIKHMLYTTVPAYLISLVLYALIGINFAGKTLDTAQIDLIQTTLLNHFHTLSPILLLAPISVIAMVILKVPALPALLTGTVIGGVLAMIFQGASLADVMSAMHYGYESHTGVQAVDDLLTRGGLNSMLWTVSLVLCALSFGGVLEKTGMLETISSHILKFAKGTFGLVFATLMTCIFTNIVTGDQYLAIVMPGRMYKEEYEKRDLAAKNLSRAIEDSATVTSPLIPWTTCGSYMLATLGLNPIAFLPFAFFNLLSPIISLILAATGWSMEKRSSHH